MRHTRIVFTVSLLVVMAVRLVSAQASQANNTNLSAVTDRHLGSQRWFHDQRAYPFQRIPPGARQNYLRQLDAMRQSEARLGTRYPHAMVQASSTTWTQIGPQPVSTVWVAAGDSGRSTSLAIDPTNANTMYLGTAGGGVWKSTDAGSTWTPLTDSQASLATGAIAIDPNNPSTIYVGTGEANQSGDSYYGAGILKSNDGGATWTQIAGPFLTAWGGGPISFGSLAVDPGNSSVVLAGTYNGIYRSTDAGQTWTSVLPSATGYSVIFDPTNPSTAYAALGSIFGSPANGIYKSSNAGATWTRVTGTGANVLPTQNLGRMNLAMDPLNPATLYTSISNCCAPFSGIIGIYKSTDGGTNWTQTGNPPSCCDWYGNALAVEPGNPNVVFAGDGSLYRSTDGGQTWTAIGGYAGTPGLHPDMHAIAFSPGAGTMYVANDGGIFSSTNLGSSWTDLNATISTVEFYPGMSLDPSNINNAFAGTQDNGTEHYSGTLAWNYVTCGDGGWTAIDPSNPSNVYANCIGVSLVKSINGGASFFGSQNGLNASDRGGWAEPVVVDPSNPQTLYYGTYRIYQSTDGANSWNPISGDLSKGNGTIVAIAVAPTDSNTIYVTTSDGNVQMTANASAGAGATWSNVTAAIPNRFITNVAVDPQIATLVYVTVGGFGSGHIFETTNAGASWSDISGNLPNAPTNDVAVDPDQLNTLYVGTDAGVFATQDGGKTWSTMVQALPRVVIQSIKMHHATRILRVASHGRSAWDLQVPASPLTVSASSSTLTFGNQNYQTTSAAQAVSLTWNGRSTLAPTIAVTGDFGETDNCGGSVPAGGSCTINVTFTPTSSGTRNGSLTVSTTAGTRSFTLTGTGLSIFSLSSTPTTAAVSHSAQSAVFNLTLTPQGGAFNNPVLLSCAGLPSLSNCVFSPNSVTPGASVGSSTLTITTQAAFSAAGQSIFRSYGTLALGLPICGLIGLGRKRKFLTRPIRAFSFTCLVALAFVLPSCGGSGPGGGGGSNPPPATTPSGNYTITVTGNGATDQASLKLSLTVQ